MKILAFDTATATLGVIGAHDDRYVAVSANIGYHHGESLFPWIEQVCRELDFAPKECDLVICTLGPGSFTGLRIGLATAKGISTAAACPLVGVPTLDCYAAGQAGFPGTVFPIIDAKKSRYYTASYADGLRCTEYLDLSAEEIIAMTGKDPVLFTGPDCGLLLPAIEKSFGPAAVKNTIGSADIFADGKITVFRSPVDLYRLVERGTAVLEKEGPLPPTAGPIYLRRSEAEIHHEKMQAEKKTDG